MDTAQSHNLSLSISYLKTYLQETGAEKPLLVENDALSYLVKSEANFIVCLTQLRGKCHGHHKNFTLIGPSRCLWYYLAYLSNQDKANQGKANQG